VSLRLWIPAARQRITIGSGHVLEELFDQIDVGKDHTAAAVALKTNIVKGFTRWGMY
jgi:hypothetical protein